VIRIWRSVLTAVFAMSILPVSVALAAAPDTETFNVDETFIPPLLSAACGFDVTRHIEGTLTVRTFYDADGNFVRELDSYRLTETLSANGQTLVGRTVQNILVKFYSDGSFAVAFMGSDFRLSVLGSGISFGSVGRFVLLFDSSGDVQVVQDVGDARADYDAICAALTAA
jgi:hypothetical protein